MGLEIGRRGPPRAPTPLGAPDPGLAHQPLDLAARHPLPGTQQRLPRAPIAVGLVVGLVDLADHTQQPLVGHRPNRPGTGRALVVGGRRHAQSPADGPDPETAAVLIDVAAHFGRSESSSLAKHRRGLQDLVRAAQLIVLGAQPADLLPLLRARQIRALAAIGLVLTDPLSQRLRMHPEIRRYLSDRPLRLKRQPDPPLHKLVRELLRSGHPCSLDFPQDRILASRSPSNSEDGGRRFWPGLPCRQTDPSGVVAGTWRPGRAAATDP